MMKERQAQILAYLKESRTASVEDLAQHLYVSSATVRRDLTEMQRLGLVERSYGGVVLLEQAEEVSIYVRMNENAHEKELVATKALKVLPEHVETIFLDSSSTVLALAQRMDLAHKTVVTNNLQTALSLSRVAGINLIILGGTVTGSGVSATGSWTNEQLRDFRFDLMICSCFAIKDKKLYENSVEQREIKRTAYRNSDYRILLADRSKLDKRGVYLFCGLEDFDKIVFDDLTEEESRTLGSLPNIY